MSKARGRPLRWLWMGLGLVLGVAWWLTVSPALAQEGSTETPTPVPPPPNDYCLGCHADARVVTLPSGEPYYVAIDAAKYAGSVHGSGGYLCVQCHTNISEYPHAPLTAQDRRDVSLQMYTLCQTCHADKYELTHDSAHAAALEAGNKEAAVCTDCHNPHEQGRLTDPVTNETLPAAHIEIPETCARCHSAIYEDYKETVHGEALVTGNPDVPTCIDCHGVHQIEDPRTAEFRLKSPELCAGCHTDATIMDKYGISTDVLNTYLADFHGTTVTLFEKQSPDQITNKPVCTDCHGVHDIKHADDPEKGLHVKENVLLTCQKCHPDATTNFSDAWLSHYIPDRERYPIVYYVNVFYKFFIPLVLGAMAIFVVSDVGRTLLKRRPTKNGGGSTPALVTTAPPAEPDDATEPVITPPADSDPPRGDAA